VEGGGVAMAEDRAGATGQDGGHPAPLGLETRVAHGIDAAMESVQPLARHQRFYGLGREAKGRQLAATDHTVLAFGQLCQTCVIWWLLSSPNLHTADRGTVRCDRTRRVWNLSSTPA
jgi:hypothetical protein